MENHRESPGEMPSPPASQQATTGGTHTARSRPGLVGSFIPPQRAGLRRLDTEASNHPAGAPGSGHRRCAAPSKSLQVDLLRTQSSCCPCPCPSSIPGVGLSPPKPLGLGHCAQKASWRVPTSHGEFRADPGPPCCLSQSSPAGRTSWEPGPGSPCRRSPLGQRHTHRILALVGLGAGEPVWCRCFLEILGHVVVADGVQAAVCV